MATSPSRQPRLLKVRTTLVKYGVRFTVFQPRATSAIKNRTVRAIVNYVLFILQTAIVNADVVWVSNCPDITALSFAFLRRRYVYDYRSPWSMELAIDFGNGLFYRASKVVEKIARRYAAVIVVVSKRMARDVTSLGTPIFVVPNYPFRDFAANVDRATFRRRLGVSESAKVVIFMGRLTRIEGADLLGEVAETLAGIPDTKLWVVGDGNLRDYIQGLVSKYPNTVTLFGWVLHSDVPNYIAAADVSIMPRHSTPNAEYYSEEGVHKISESLWLGTPVVASNAAKSQNYTSADEGSFIKTLVSFLSTPVMNSANIPAWEELSEPELIKAISTAAGLARG